jgi:hypothetical protein
MLLHVLKVICIQHFAIQLVARQLTLEHKIHYTRSNALFVVGILYDGNRHITGQARDIGNQVVHLFAAKVVVNQDVLWAKAIQPMKHRREVKRQFGQNPFVWNLLQVSTDMTKFYGVIPDYQYPPTIVSVRLNHIHLDSLAVRR